VSFLRSALVTAIGATAIYLATTGSVAITQELPDPVEAAVPPPVLIIDRRNSQLTIAGDVRSTAHESRLQLIAESFLTRKQVDTELRIRTPLPPAWPLVTELVLRAIGATHTSTAYVDEQQIFIRGFTPDQVAWMATTARLEEHLPPGVRFRYEVEELKIGASLEEQCRQLFAAASTGRRIGFKQASDELNSNAYSLLDEMVQIAADCPSAAILITGHTDNSGNEETNRYLSKARADSVVAFMIGRGIAAERLQSLGAGSSEPLVSEDNRRARELNRRIEFSIEFP